MGDEQIEALRGQKTMPTMLPGCAFFLGIGYPPARKMIDAGLAVALASDFNPGTAPSGNMRFVVSLGSIKMKMTPAEALNAATLNSACAMGESRDYGSITRGKVANFYITKPLPSLAYLPYAHQTPVIREIVLKGKRINR
jgi:imidazolonepropionase